MSTTTFRANAVTSGWGAPRVTVSLLDGFRIDVDGQRVDAGIGTQRLVAYVGLRPGVNRTVAAAELWPDAGEAEGRATLRTALWRQQHSPGLVQSSGPALSLGSAALDVDTLCRAAADLRDGRIVQASRLLPERAGELLPGWYDEWVLVERERLRQVRLHALEALASLLLEQGRYAEALEVTLASIRSEPLRETPYRLLLRIHLDEGNPSEAIRQYRAYRGLLRDELQIEPSPSLAGLVAHLEA